MARHQPKEKEIARKAGKRKSIIPKARGAVPVRPVFYRITCDEEAATENQAELYAKGVCPHCGTGRGRRRAAIPRRLAGRTKDDVVCTDEGLHVLFLVSEPLKKLLQELGLPAGAFAPAVDAAGRQLYEFDAAAQTVSWVGLTEKAGIRAKAVGCPQCGGQSFIFVHRVWGKGIWSYISRRDAEKIAAAASLAGAGGAAEPLLRADGYVRFLTAKNIRGLELLPVGVVEDEEIEDPVICTPVGP